MRYALSLLFFCLFATTAFATPVGPMNYQGRLLDNSGIPVTGSYNFVVKVYDDPVAGVLKYQETHTGVSVDDGVYSFKVGTQTAQAGTWDLNLWQQNLNDLYLELSVNGETLTPRHELTSAPHAFTSTLALSTAKLGNVPTDQLLVVICEADGGVWLDGGSTGPDAARCLGPGSDFSVAAVGGSVVAISTLHTGLDFSGINLTGADISGIDFADAVFDKAIFANTTVDMNGLDSVNASFVASQWDGVNNISAGIVAVEGDFSYAVGKNMDMSKWDFSLTNLHRKEISFAYLTACPSAFPGNTTCEEQATAGRYYLRGFWNNYGQNGMGLWSALLKENTSNSGYRVMDVNDGAFDNTGVMDEMVFRNSWVNTNFTDVWLTKADFEGALLRNVNFKNVDMYKPGSEVAGYFKNATLEGVSFSGYRTLAIVNLDFTGASLRNVNFSLDTGNNPQGWNFTNATLDGVFLPVGRYMNFTNAKIKDSSLQPSRHNIPDAGTVTLNGTHFTGNLNITIEGNGDGNPLYHATFNDVKFLNATLRRDRTYGNTSWEGLNRAQFNNSRFEDVNIHQLMTYTVWNTCVFYKVNIHPDSSFANASFTNCSFSEVYVESGASLQGVSFTSSTGQGNIWFYAGSICPNGTTVTTAGSGTQRCGL